MSQDTTPFPLFFDDPADAWTWPRLPFDWEHEPVDMSAPPACRIEDMHGLEASGALLELDPGAEVLVFRPDGHHEPVKMPLGSVRRLTLIEPLCAAAPRPGTAVALLPVAAQEREVVFESVDDLPPMVIASLGRVEASEGMYLFPPFGQEDKALLRVLVPRAAYRRCAVGPTAEERAAERWIFTARDLLAAVDRQPHAKVMPIGQALLALGLITPTQLHRALQRQTGDKPLGQMLVEAGHVSKADLYTALGHKMGYPLVDLTRFPIDPAAATKLPLRMATESRALPLMLDGRRLIVAIDRLARLPALRGLRAFEQLNIVPVLASKGQIVLALNRLARQDIWGHAVPQRLGVADTTI